MISTVLLILPPLSANARANPAPTRPAGDPSRSSSGGEKVKPNPGSSQPREALDKGKALLRRNQSAEALGHIETALRLFMQAGDSEGQAAAHDAVGDLYARNGQYRAALTEYQSAYGVFRTEKTRNNANAVLAKMGDLHYLMGNVREAEAAFAQMDASDGGDRDDQRGGAVMFLKAGASTAPGAAPSLASCFSAGGDGDGDQSREPANMGHAPNMPDGIGRADVRVVDQDGNPVKGAKAKVNSKRPNGFSCESWETTDAVGRALVPPLHVGQLKLSVAADGFQPLETALAPEQLAQPLRVVLSKKGTQAASRLAQSAGGNGALARCFDLYRLFTNYVTGEIGLGRASFLGGRYDEANKHFNNVLAASDAGAPAGKLARASRFRAAARTGLGDVAFRTGNYQEALRLYDDAVKGATQDRRYDLVWAAQRGVGRTLWTLAGQETDPAKAAKLQSDALKAYQDSISTIETLFSGSLRSDEARTSFLAVTKDVFDEAAGAYADLALAAASKSSPVLDGVALTKAAVAFRIAEQGRARSLLDLLSETHAEITEGVSPELIKRKGDIQARQHEIVETLTGVSVKAQTPERPVGALESELKELELAHISVENQLRVSSPRYAALNKPQPLTLPEVQQQVLDSKTALLEYSLGGERSYLWAVTGGGVQLYKLPARAEVEKLAAEFRAGLIPKGLRRSLVVETDDGDDDEVTRGLTLAREDSPAKVGAYAAAANALYRAVVEPAAGLVGDSRLLVVADGALNSVPFEALVTSAEGSSYDALPYLVKTHEVVYAPSASVIAAVRAQAAGAAPVGGMLLVADPVFDASDPRVKEAMANSQGQGMSARSLQLASALEDMTNSPLMGLKLARLSGTRAESNELARLALTAGRQPEELLDFSASKSNLLKRDLRQYCILHFATHGILNAERPQFTGLALSSVGEGGGDGFLRVDEVFNLRLGSPLVMLSACETGLGKQSRGEGVIGLTRAFMYAGAPTVGVSLWSVADRATAELMPEFYKHLFAKEPSAAAPAALRAAQQSMINGKRFSAPFYWAPFVLVGDWR